MNKTAQSFSMDFAISILLFVVGMTLSLNMLGDVFDQREFDLLLQSTNQLASALVGPGYPDYWDETDVVRAGVMSDGRVSMRKLAHLQELDPDALKTVLPSLFNFGFFLEDRDGIIIPLGDNCSIGAIPAVATPLTINRTIAYYYRSTDKHALLPWASANGADIYTNGQLSDLIAHAYNYSILLFENPEFSRQLNETFSAKLLREQLAQVAQYGPHILLTGNLSVPVFGVNTTNNASNGTVIAHSEEYFGLTTGFDINFSTPQEVVFLPSDATLLGKVDGAVHSRVMAQEGTHTIAARWQYADALLYYFSDTAGEYAGNLLVQMIENGLDALKIQSTVSCVMSPENIQADHLIKTERLVAANGDIQRLKLYVWDNEE